MTESWQSVIEKLEAKQKSLPPGDPRILDIASVIQSIEADALGGNYGHARFFMTDPNAKKSTLQGIRRLVIEFVPEMKGKRITNPKV